MLVELCKTHLNSVEWQRQMAVNDTLLTIHQATLTAVWATEKAGRIFTRVANIGCPGAASL